MFDKRADIIRFLAVVEADSISLAADRLHMTQPTLTRVISRLERQFTGRLFERLPKGVRLTELGVAAAMLARRIQTELDAAEAQFEAVRAGRVGTIRVTAGPVWIWTVLPHAVSEFHRTFPGVEIKIDPATRPEGLRRLANGSSDIHCGGIDDGERLPDFLRRERFFNATAGIVAHLDHPLQSRNITIEDLASCPWIDYDPYTPTIVVSRAKSFSHIIHQIHERSSARVRTIVRTSSASLLLMSSAPYLSWLSLTHLERIRGGVVRPLPTRFGRIQYRTGFVVRRSSEALSAFRRFETILRRTMLNWRG